MSVDGFLMKDKNHIEVTGTKTFYRTREILLFPQSPLQHPLPESCWRHSHHRLQSNKNTTSFICESRQGNFSRGEDGREFVGTHCYFTLSYKDLNGYKKETKYLKLPRNSDCIVSCLTGAKWSRRTGRVGWEPGTGCRHLTYCTCSFSSVLL